MTDNDDRYEITTVLNDRVIDQRPIPDPFVCHTVDVSWRDLLASLARRGLKLQVRIHADRATINAVLRLPRPELGTDPEVRRQ